MERGKSLMRLNFILIFALIITSLATFIFALSSVIGESIVRHHISSFFERELIKDYKIEKFNYDGLHIDFDINIEDNVVAKVVGSIFFEKLIIELNFKMTNVESKWLRKYKDIGRFSSFGVIEINLFGTKVDTTLTTEREIIKFKYRTKFVTKERYLDIQNSKISVKTFNKLTDLNIIGKYIEIDGELIGDGEIMSGDINISIDNIDMSGDLEYSPDYIKFQGYSEELNGDINLNITEDNQVLSFENVMIQKILELFKVDLDIYGDGDILLNYSENHISFQGEFGRVGFNQNQNLDYIGEILNMHIDKTMFDNAVLSGTIKDNSIIFNLKTSNNGVDFKIDDGIYNANRKYLYFKSDISINSDEIASISYNSLKPTIINLNSSGERRFKRFVIDSSKESNYKNDIEKLIELY